MATFLGTNLEFIELNDTTWRTKVNSNFTVLTAAQIKTANYTVDSSPPTNSTTDHTIFVDPAGDTTITLPALGMGKSYIVIRKDTGSVLKVAPHSGGAINALSADATITVGTAIGATVFIFCDGVKWYANGDFS
tara:strand:- start:118 stop:519 length:402 start_codon:yes stop_codon:yes gene_type:complete